MCRKTIFFFSDCTTLTSDNLLHFRKNFLERIQKLIINIDDKTRDEKLQYDINREAAKILALSSGKTDIYMNIFQVKRYYPLILAE